jgi:hypothetical protein
MTTIKGVLDRFEGDWAVIQLLNVGESQNLLRNLLPRTAKEGDYLQLKIEDGEIVGVYLDPEATEAAQKRIEEKLNRLRRGEHLHDD